MLTLGAGPQSAGASSMRWRSRGSGFGSASHDRPRRRIWAMRAAFCRASIPALASLSAARLAGVARHL